jgi:hypothetical protein
MVSDSGTVQAAGVLRARALAHSDLADVNYEYNYVRVLLLNRQSEAALTKLEKSDAALEAVQEKFQGRLMPNT